MCSVILQAYNKVFMLFWQIWYEKYCLDKKITKKISIQGRNTLYILLYQCLNEEKKVNKLILWLINISKHFCYKTEKSKDKEKF